MLDIRIKAFEELNIHELYEILRLRSEIFVVEQNCVYQDLDRKDQIAYHVLGYYKNKLAAYTRIFDKGQYLDHASIGRVVVDQAARSLGLGKKIMVASIDAVKKLYNEDIIIISAQSYLNKFYSDLGFVKIGDEYLEDGIPHTKMIRE
ncbi:GNAT family N-acetyltransferase [Aegicerativicinus sediminis]|uniref:GNAT family N-acetyltransferase n=1 Tax=Aegicerativicinus sediminis TaxID=2893202 RepID=UPI001E50B780|nr:GNAT family N-acetyltransferase [Aegicerativicinus sediminis]